jgi:ABC-type lipoprotein export system ATPase subunit
MGESGCGKSTFLNIIAGLIPPDFGTLTYDKQKRNLNFQSERVRAQYRYQYIGLIPQGISLINHYSILENLRFALHAHRLFQKDAEEKALDILHDLHLFDKVDEKVKHLSMGQKQRVAIARALVLERPLILADEPTSALDQASSELVLDLLNQSAATVVIASHDYRVESICNRAYSFQNGNLKDNSIIK